jgi:MFS family permease
MTRPSPRVAVTALFFLNGVTFSSFFARLPAIKHTLGASDGELGIALFLATLGLVVAQPVAGALAARYGARGPGLMGQVVYALGLPAAAAAPSVPALAGVLFAMGLANGVLDVAINVEGVAVERRMGRRVLASMHAFFSFGGMTGAAIGGLAAAAGVGPVPHLAAMAAAILAACALTAPGLPAPQVEERGARRLARPSRALVALGAAAFCVLLAEGSVTDWSAVFLRDGTGASEGLAAAGLTAFSLSMAASRLAGDRVADRLGPGLTVRAGGVVAAAGLGLGLALAVPGAGIAGYAVMGLGLGACFPLIVAASAALGPGEEAASIAAVSGAGYVGLTAGPASIGLLSDAAGLRQALLLVLILCLAATLVGGAAGRGASRPAS